jgi:hypothetical protein
MAPKSTSTTSSGSWFMSSAPPRNDLVASDLLLSVALREV